MASARLHALFNISFHVSLFIFHLPFSICVPFYWNPNSCTSLRAPSPLAQSMESMPSLPMPFIMQTSNSFKFYYSLCFQWRRRRRRSPSLSLSLILCFLRFLFVCVLFGTLLSHSGSFAIQSHRIFSLHFYLSIPHISTMNVKCACIRCIQWIFHYVYITCGIASD